MPPAPPTVSEAYPRPPPLGPRAVGPAPWMTKAMPADVVAGVARLRAVRVAPLHDRLVVRRVGRVEHEVVRRPGGQVVPEHDAGLGPEVRGAGADQAGDDRAVARDALVDVLHVVVVA